jgi:hypothetical protein
MKSLTPVTHFNLQTQPVNLAQVFSEAQSPWVIRIILPFQPSLFKWNCLNPLKLRKF